MHNPSNRDELVRVEVSNRTPQEILQQMLEYFYEESKLDMKEQLLYGSCEKCVCKHRISAHIVDIPYEFKKRYPCTQCKCPGLSYNNLEYLEWAYEAKRG